MVVLVKKKYQFVFIFLVIIIILSSCSGGLNNPGRIDIKTDKLRFNEVTSEKIRTEFGLVFFEIVRLSIDWYNIYIKNPDDDRIISIEKELSDLIFCEMPNKLLSESLQEFQKHFNKNKDIMEYEEEIFKESLLLVGEILFRIEQDQAILEEEKLREKNLKNMDDEMLYKLKNNKTKHINTIKDNIIKILEKYY